MFVDSSHSHLHIYTLSKYVKYILFTLKNKIKYNIIKPSTHIIYLSTCDMVEKEEGDRAPEIEIVSSIFAIRCKASRFYVLSV